MSPRAVQQRGGPEHVRVHESRRPADAAIDMRLRGEVHHREEAMLLHQRVDLRRVGDVRVEEFIALAIGRGDPFEIRKIPGIGQRIHIRDHSRPIVLEHMPDEIAADEAAAASDEETHGRGL